MQFIRIALFTISTILFTSFHAKLNAQDLDFPQAINNASGSPNHEFRNADGEVVAEGNFVEVKSSKAVIRLSDGTQAKIPLATLSDEDREWVMAEVKKKKAQEVAKKKFYKLMDDNLTSLTEAKVVTGLERVAKLGKDATFATPVVKNYLNDTHPETVRTAALSAYISVKPALATGLQEIFTALINDTHGINSRIIKHPDDFMAAIATFEEIGLPYLKMVAFSGSIIPEDADPVPPVEPSTDLTAEQNLARAAAVAALSTMPGEDILEVIMIVLEASENPDEGDPEKSTIRACLIAFGEIGITNDAIEEKLNYYQADEYYAKQITRIRKKIESAQAKNED